MTISQLTWLSGIIIAIISSNIGILKYVNSDKIKRPIVQGGLLNLVIGITLSTLSYFIINWLVAIGVFLFCGTFFVYLVIFLKNRDKKGIIIGEQLIQAHHILDQQICFIVRQIKRRASKPKIRIYVKQTLEIMLSELHKLFTKNGSGDTTLSLIKTEKDGTFKVIAYCGIKVPEIVEMERKFRYSPEPVSIAGNAAKECKYLIVPDLENETDTLYNKWIPVVENQKQTGFIVCYPIKSCDPDQDVINPLGVLSISSSKKDDFDGELIKTILESFESKIEMLIYML